MRIFLNFREVRGPFGGANAFLRTLKRELERRGVALTNDPRAEVDVALLNALTEGIDLPFVRRLAEQGVPVVHRKVGYRVSGSPEMRRTEAGVVVGDRLQIEFSPFVAHTIFQSEYSRGAFATQGFEGPASVIRNGVDERIFGLQIRRFGRTRPRTYWTGTGPLRVVISTWSTDPNKGFDDYARIDATLGRLPDVEVSLVGRVPASTRFRSIRVLRPRRAQRLARVLQESHVVLQLARYETCSNALLEGLSCGLPAIYLDSGANAELAAPYGVAYDGDFEEAESAIRERYRDDVDRLQEQPFRIGPVADRYLELLETVASGRRAVA